MNIELPNGVPVDITTAISAVDTDEISVESNFDTNKSVYLALSATAPSSIAGYDATLTPNRDGPMCFRKVQGVAGLKVWALNPFTPSNETVDVRVNKG